MLNTASLPDGREFEFWEQEEKYSCELHVDCKNPVANDSNDGSAERPFRTIQAAAEVAEAGTRVLIHGGGISGMGSSGSWRYRCSPYD